MTYYPTILVDTGLLVAFYDSADSHHHRVVEFFAGCTSRLVKRNNQKTAITIRMLRYLSPAESDL